MRLCRRPDVARWALLPILVWVCAVSTEFARADQAEELKFFETKIRPVLVEQCYSCHSAGAKILRGGLLLDSRDGLLKGGDSGPAVVPGKPEESVLIEALNFESYEMPPSGKLPKAVIADFETWIKRGAADPRTGPAVVKKSGMDLETGRKFWSFRPIEHPTPPQVKDAAWPSDPLDRFVLAKLEEKGLHPAMDAAAEALVRRVYFDLVGLPPSADEVAAFGRAAGKNGAQAGAKAYADLVDRLLASPQFGERWGRHWLDVARFAESSGGGRSMVFKEAWRYRDYVLRSFNNDKPFDQFIIEQIAGDLLSHEDDATFEEHVVATAYLVLGANNYEEQDKKVLEFDVVDEQIEAVGKGLLGMTIGCARCHDHKFDPIPTADYYALAGIFRSTHTLVHSNVSNWTEVDLPMTAEQAAALEAHKREVAALKKQIDTMKRASQATESYGLPKGPLPVKDLPGIVVDDEGAKKIGEWTSSKYGGSYLGEGFVHDADKGKGSRTITFQPEFKKRGLYEVRLAYVSGSNRADAVPIEILSCDGEFSTKVDMKQKPPIDGRFLTLGRFNFDEANQWFVMISNEGTKGVVAVDGVQFLPIEEKPAAPKAAAPKEVATSAGNDKAKPSSDALAELEKSMKKLTSSAPPRPKAMAVSDAATIADCPICVRGNVHVPDTVVPRGVLQVATIGPAPEISSEHSGRLELARWIADGRNPLTARVYVNRVWHHLFGVGLVRTVDNFGVTGETPSHPELLDHLASRFVDEGWSTKRLLREIVLSRTYRMSSTMNPQAAKVDPENRLLWRMNRKRLDAEALRDAMLAVSGKLDRTVGGQNIGDPSIIKEAGNVNPTEYGYVFADTRRSVYTPAFRNRMLELFEAFDMADQNSVSGKRNVSTVAPQALYMLNAPFVMEQARAAAERALAWDVADDAARVERAFRETIGRAPTAGERKISLAAIAAPAELARTEESNDPKVAAWERLFQALFGCLDFRYVD